MLKIYLQTQEGAALALLWHVCSWGPILLESQRAKEVGVSRNLDLNLGNAVGSLCTNNPEFRFGNDRNPCQPQGW